jgi:plasminogen activator inhibitor 1 RNA-binding protein
MKGVVVGAVGVAAAGLSAMTAIAVPLWCKYLFLFRQQCSVVGLRLLDHRLTKRSSDSEKQINQGWGAPKGDAEWNDEQAGEAIAKAEENAEGEVATAEASASKEESAAAAEPEPEDNTKSYSEYLAELAEKKMQVGGAPPARKPNEGSKQDKKWAKAKELRKDEDEEAYIAGAGGKAKRERQRKEKSVLEIDQRYIEPSRGNREGGRGGRGRGEGRGEFRGGDRGRGGRGRGEGRSEFRGGRGGQRGGAQVNVADTEAFPSLGK